MGLTNFPHGITSFGVPVIGATNMIPVTTGSYFWVDSNTGLSGNTGKDKTKPLATIAQALLKCMANKGDVIVCMPGHAETITAAGGITINVAGVQIIGLGEGSLRPTITYTTAATGTLLMTAANCKLKNFILRANFADVAGAIVVSGTDCSIEDCLFSEAAINMNFLTCVKTGAVANGADGLKIIRNERISIDAAALAFVSILEATNRLVIADNFDNQSSAADIGHFIILGAFTVLGARIVKNVLNLNGDNSAQTVGVFMTGSSTNCTGIVAYNLVNNLDATTEIFDTATLDFGHFVNYMTGAIAKSGYLLPAADA